MLNGKALMSVFAYDWLDAMGRDGIARLRGRHNQRSVPRSLSGPCHGRITGRGRRSLSFPQERDKRVARRSATSRRVRVTCAFAGSAFAVSATTSDQDDV